MIDVYALSNSRSLVKEQRIRRRNERDREITSRWLPMNKLSSCLAFIFLFVLCVDVNEKIYTMCVIYTRIMRTDVEGADSTKNERGRERWQRGIEEERSKGRKESKEARGMKERRKRCGGSRSSQARAKYDVDPLQKTDTGYLGYRRPCSGVNAIKKASIRPSRRTSLISESRRSSFLLVHRRFRRRPPPRRRLLFFHLLLFLIHLLCKRFCSSHLFYAFYVPLFHRRYLLFLPYPSFRQI